MRLVPAAAAVAAAATALTLVAPAGAQAAVKPSDVLSAVQVNKTTGAALSGTVTKVKEYAAPSGCAVPTKTLKAKSGRVGAYVAADTTSPVQLVATGVLELKSAAAAKKFVKGHVKVSKCATVAVPDVLSGGEMQVPVSTFKAPKVGDSRVGYLQTVTVMGFTAQGATVVASKGKRVVLVTVSHSGTANTKAVAKLAKQAVKKA